MYSNERREQSRIEDVILQNWIATQTLAQEVPAFQPK